MRSLKLNFVLTAVAGLSLLGFTNSTLALTANDTAHVKEKLSQRLNSDIQEFKREVDFNHTLHIWLQESYLHYDIIGAVTTLHLANAQLNEDLQKVLKNPNSFMTGVFYQNIKDDLGDSVPASILSDSQKQAALQALTKSYVDSLISEEIIKPIVYVDKNNKAHWAFFVTFLAKNRAAMEKVSGILDADTLKIYTQYQFSQPNLPFFAKSPRLRSHHYDQVKIGGVGGNQKTGFIFYDDLPGQNHLGPLLAERDPLTKTCYLQDQNIVIRDWNQQLDVVQFPCEKTDGKRGGIYWFPYLDFTNGALNPALDTLYAAEATRNMFESMYHAPLWEYQNHGIILNFFIHGDFTGFVDGAWFSEPNALWYISISDGDQKLFPRVALDTIAALIGRGYKSSHSYYAWGHGPMVGTCYAFNDFFGKAVEFFQKHQNVWSLGADVTKAKDKAIRYLDAPTKDCEGRKPGDNCSIDNVYQTTDIDGIEGQYAAGVLNKALYLLTKSPAWNTTKTFEVMIQANHYYWILPDDPRGKFNYNNVACGMYYAAKDYQYNTQDVQNAFMKVGVDISKNCY